MLIPGKYYHIIQNNETKRHWLLRVREHAKDGNVINYYSICLSSTTPFLYNNGEKGYSHWGKEHSIEQAIEASPEEIEYLEACVKAGKVLEGAEKFCNFQTTQNYEIY